MKLFFPKLFDDLLLLTLGIYIALYRSSERKTEINFI
jgi:hypothetical protein